MSIWPKGKFNGRKIAGLRLALSINVFRWYWLPTLDSGYGEPMAAWLCFVVRARAEYKAFEIGEV